MALSIGELKSLCSFLGEELSGVRLGHLLPFSSDAFFFRLPKGKRLCIVLDNADPRIYVSEKPFDASGTMTPFGLLLKKYVAGAVLNDVSLYGEDRVLCFNLSSVNDVFKEETVYLIAELIPGKANLALLDAKKTVLGGLRTNLITDPRPLFRGIAYEPPLSKNLVADEGKPFDQASYTASCEAKEPLLFEKRKKEKFHPILKSLETKRKAIERKIKAIQGDLEAALKHREDGIVGDYIYTNYSEIGKNAKSVIVDGVEYEFDPRCSLSENANRFYKRAKKAKATLEEGRKNLEKAEQELQETKQAIAIIKKADEDALESLAKDYGLLNGPKEKAKLSLGESSLLPMECVCNGVSYLFGRSARQNDFLTFLYETKKTYLWMHVKDNHGAHLILRKENPSNEEIELGAELALLASKMESGEVMYALHRDVRRGAVPGQAVVKEYSSCYIRLVSKKAREAFENAKKAKVSE